jgi:lipopolysaccharide transport system permease protein
MFTVKADAKLRSFRVRTVSLRYETAIMTAVPSVRAHSAARTLNPIAVARSLWAYRNLIYQFTRRDIEGRYRGSFLGIFWSLAQPLFMLLVYTLVFGVIFKSRWPQARTDSLGEFALIAFCGLIAFGLVSECITRAPALIIGVPNYVKKVVFPLETLALSTLGAALFQLGVSLVVLLAAQLVMVGSLPWTVVLLPVVLIPAMFFSLGAMWLLASVGVFVRDIGQLVGIVMQMVFFLTPILYSIEAIPAPLRTLILINPIAPIVENFRRVLLWGTLPSARGLVLWSVVTGIWMLLGYAWFMKTKKAFADVI